MPLSLTVVVPTHNRHTILKRVLQHLAAGSVQPDEVIIVDDGSEPSVREALNGDLFGSPEITVIRHKKSRGAAAARNSGAIAATKEIIIFIDDDVFPDLHCLRYHQMIHCQNPGSEYGVMGRIYFDPDLTRTPLMHYLEEVGNFVEISKGEDRIAQRKGLISANFSLKRAFLKEKKVLFDENFPYSQTEDTEFGSRMIAQGWDLHYHIAPSARHHSQISLDNFFEKVWQGGVSKAYWSLKSPGDTSFANNLRQVVLVNEQKESFRQISERYLETIGPYALTEDISMWDRFAYDRFLTWIRNSFEHHRDLGIYDGWLRYVDGFAQISANIVHALTTPRQHEKISRLKSAWERNKKFLPAGLLLSDHLTKAGLTKEAVVLLADMGDSLPVLQRLMNASATQHDADKSINFAMQIYDQTNTRLMTHKRYRQQAIKQIMSVCKSGQLDPAWGIHAWEQLRASDLADHESWVQWLHVEIATKYQTTENASLEAVLERNNDLRSIESSLRMFCADSSLEFMERDGAKTPPSLSVPSSIEDNALQKAREDHTIGLHSLQRTDINGRGEVVSAIENAELPTLNQHQPLASTASTHRGVVTWYNPEKRFGFARCEVTDNLCFLHASSVSKDSPLDFKPGDQVRFNVLKTALGREASSLIREL